MTDNLFHDTIFIQKGKGVIEIKVRIKYWEVHEREVEMTEEEYWSARANTSTRPDLFPEGSFNRENDEVVENKHYWDDEFLGW